MTAVKLLPLLEGVHWSREKDFQAYALPNVEARPSVQQAVALAQQHAAVDGAMVERAVAGYAAGPWAAFSPEASREAHRDRMCAALTAALAAQPGGSDNDQ